MLCSLPSSTLHWTPPLPPSGRAHVCPLSQDWPVHQPAAAELAPGKALCSEVCRRANGMVVEVRRFTYHQRYVVFKRDVGRKPTIHICCCWRGGGAGSDGSMKPTLLKVCGGLVCCNWAPGSSRKKGFAVSHDHSRADEDYGIVPTING